MEFEFGFDKSIGRFHTHAVICDHIYTAINKSKTNKSLLFKMVLINYYFSAI